MKAKYALMFVGLGLAATSSAYPLFPRITGYDWNFGSLNMPDGPAEWATNGAAADTLIYTPSPLHNEVTAFWPAWPLPPPLPVFDIPGTTFGGDFVLGVMFTGQDAPYVGATTIDVSLTGTGLNPGPAPDLMIFGTTAGVSGMLWAIDLNVVSLYGYSTQPSYVLEGGGTIVGGLIAERYGLIGQSGVMRGNIDFFDPAVMLPALYNPMVNYNIPPMWRAAYSGETGRGYVAPEPVSLLTIGGLLAALAARRRK